MAAIASPHAGIRFWSEREVQYLRKLAKENTPTRVMSLKLGRTVSAIRSKAASLRLSLKPVNRSPYGTVSRRRRKSR